MKTDRIGFSLVSLAVVAGLVLALVNPSPAAHSRVVTVPHVSVTPKN